MENPVTITGDLNVTSNQVLRSFLMGVTIVAGNLHIAANPKLTSLELSFVEHIGASLNVTNNMLVKRLDMPLLTFLGSSLDVKQCQSLDTINLAALEGTIHNVTIVDSLATMIINLASLEGAADLRVDIAELQELRMPSLANARSVNIKNSRSGVGITRLSMGRLTTVFDTFMLTGPGFRSDPFPDVHSLSQVGNLFTLQETNMADLLSFESLWRVFHAALIINNNELRSANTCALREVEQLAISNSAGLAGSLADEVRDGISFSSECVPLILNIGGLLIDGLQGTNFQPDLIWIDISTGHNSKGNVEWSKTANYPLPVSNEVLEGLFGFQSASVTYAICLPEGDLYINTYKSDGSGWGYTGYWLQTLWGEVIANNQGNPPNNGLDNDPKSNWDDRELELEASELFSVKRYFNKGLRKAPSSVPRCGTSTQLEFHWLTVPALGSDPLPLVLDPSNGVRISLPPSTRGKTQAISVSAADQNNTYVSFTREEPDPFGGTQLNNMTNLAIGVSFLEVIIPLEGSTTVLVHLRPTSHFHTPRTIEIELRPLYPVVTRVEVPENSCTSVSNTTLVDCRASGGTIVTVFGRDFSLTSSVWVRLGGENIVANDVASSKLTFPLPSRVGTDLSLYVLQDSSCQTTNAEECTNPHDTGALSQENVLISFAVATVMRLEAIPGPLSGCKGATPAALTEHDLAKNDITEASLVHCPREQGTMISIIGRHFGNDISTMEATVGGERCEMTHLEDTFIRCLLPGGNLIKQPVQVFHKGALELTSSNLTVSYRQCLPVATLDIASKPPFGDCVCNAPAYFGDDGNIECKASKVVSLLPLASGCSVDALGQLANCPTAGGPIIQVLGEGFTDATRFTVGGIECGTKSTIVAGSTTSGLCELPPLVGIDHVIQVKATGILIGAPRVSVSYAFPRISTLASSAGVCSIGNTTKTVRDCPRGGNFEVIISGHHFGHLVPDVLIGGVPCLNPAWQGAPSDPTFRVVVCKAPSGTGLERTVLLTARGGGERNRESDAHLSYAQCPANADFTANKLGCLCDASFYMNARKDSCVPCPVGVNCRAAGQVAEALKAESNFFVKTENGQVSVVSCLGTSCDANGSCTTGYTGNLCSECDKQVTAAAPYGHSSAGLHKCTLCPAPGINGVYLTFAALLGICVVAFLTRKSIKDMEATVSAVPPSSTVLVLKIILSGE